MKRYSLYALLMFSLAVMFVMGGCSKNSPNEPNTTLEAIDLEYGGFTASDETPDNYIVEDFDLEDPVVTDAISDDPALTALLDSGAINVYRVRFVWGYLEWDSANTVVTNWTGSATTNRGTMMILRTIRFEPGQDYVVRPRGDRKTLNWVSNTGPHFDGLYFAIVDNDSSESGIAGELTITTGLYTHTFTFDQLDSMDVQETVDNIGNQIAIQSYNKQIVPFAGGFLEGRWVRDNVRGGHFWGRWLHSTGLRAGYVKGIWGVNRDEKQVFFGKYMSINGRFKGLLKGIYEYTDEQNGLGEFKGSWLNENFSTMGRIKGIFKIGEPGDRKGFFRGKWTLNE